MEAKHRNYLLHRKKGDEICVFYLGNETFILCGGKLELENLLVGFHLVMVGGGARLTQVVVGGAGGLRPSPSLQDEMSLVAYQHRPTHPISGQRDAFTRRGRGPKI
jgi:hypothetical protein